MIFSSLFEQPLPSHNLADLTAPNPTQLSNSSTTISKKQTPAASTTRALETPTNEITEETSKNKNTMAVSTKPNSGYTRTSPFKRDAEKLRKFQEEIGIHMNNSLSYLFFSFLFCLLSEIQANWGLSIAQSYLKH